MRDFRVVMESLEIKGRHSFVIYTKAINEHCAIEQANKDYRGLFRTNRELVTEIIK